MIEKDQKIVVIGYGSVAKCLLHLLLRYTSTSPDQILVLESNANKIRSGQKTHRHVRFVTVQIDEVHLESILSQYVNSKDLLVDLAFAIDTVELLRWCQRNDVLFINTSLEYWLDSVPGFSDPTIAQTLYARQMRLRAQRDLWVNETAPTCILEHGANPGFVSYFVKQALLDMAQQQLAQQQLALLERDKQAEALETSVAQRDFAQLASLLEIQRIHITERDTQQPLPNRANGEFVNTWSPYGFFEEAVAPVEVGWGTHEPELPNDSNVPPHGPRNEIFINTRCLDTWIRSWLPSGEFSGMAIRHGELYSISRSLTCCDENGATIYRPTVIYVYRPSEQALQSLAEVRAMDYQMLHRSRVIDTEIMHGEDELGILLLRADGHSWWTGVTLSIDTARSISESDNATTVQVAGSVLAAIQWILKNPSQGILFPDDLPHDELLELALPFIGELTSYPIQWPIDADGSPLSFAKFKSTSSQDCDTYIH